MTIYIDAKIAQKKFGEYDTMKLTKEKLQSLILEAMQEQLITEAELIELLAPGLNEGILDVGRGLWDATKQTLDGMKDWAREKVVATVKKMGEKLIQFFQALKQKGILKKYAARNEINAVKTLLTNKHVDLAVMIFTAIFKLAGGYALDKLLKAPELLQKVLDILEMIKGGRIVNALRDLFGDLKDLKDMVVKAIDYSKDVKRAGWISLGNFEELGGLAEILNLQGVRQ